MCVRIAVLFAIVAFSTNPCRAEDPPRLPGTQPLTETGDLASKMIDGIDRFLLRKTAEAESKRATFWMRDLDNGIDGHVSADEPNRRKLSKILGLRLGSQPNVEMEILSTTSEGPILTQDETVRVVAVRWEAIQDIHGEGLLLIPQGPNRHVADVIAIPDSSQTPESLCGLVPGVAAESQFPVVLARSGCRVLIPVLIDRETNNEHIPHRELIQRASYELGRHVLGYEAAKVLSAVRWFEAERKKGGITCPLGAYGYGDGGAIALYTTAVYAGADVAGVSGYFGDRSRMWTEPLDRNVFGLLERFGDAEVASMIPPRKLIVEAAQSPKVSVAAGGRAAPGAIVQQDVAMVRREVDRALKFVEGFTPEPFISLVVSGDGTGPFGSREALSSFLKAMSSSFVLAEAKPLPSANHKGPDRVKRAWRQRRELERTNQEVLEDSADVRAQFFKKLDTSSLAAYTKTIEPYREIFDKEIIGRFDDPLLPLNPRSRQVFDEPKYTGYEVMLDVFPDVFAYGILLVPKGIKPGEKRPVVVCQHGLEGRPNDVADPKINNPAYNQFAIKLAERGFVTFAPQNPYIFHDRFRTLQRKANPLGKTLFSVIVPQHRQIVAWLKTQDFVDPDRIAFYGLSYGGKSAMRIPALVTDYCLSICSADFNEWVWKNASTKSNYSYIWTGEYEIFEFDLGNTFNYAEMAALIAPRPFMVERGHFDNVAPDEKVAHEYAKVRRLYNGLLKIGDRTEIEFFDGPHTIHGMGTFDFLHKHLKWSKP
jgi:dienelactone hydrolase